MKSLHSKTLKSGQVAKGNVFALAQLSARLQVWARQYGTTDAESLACWIADEPAKHETYFQNTDEVNQLAESGFAKIKGIEIPDLSEEM